MSRRPGTREQVSPVNLSLKEFVIVGVLWNLEKRRRVWRRLMRKTGRSSSDEDECSGDFRLDVGVLLRNGIVPEELAAAFRADQRRASSRFRRWEPIDNDVFDPVAMVTGTAAVVVPVGRRVPGHLRQHFL